jgi:mono/diheme cytochrome c family protein
MKKGIFIVSIIGLLLVLLTACGGASKEDTSGVARPSSPGDPGEALNLTGDPVAGKKIFDTNCPVCHGEDGKGGVENPNSVDGTVPPLNPVEPDLWDPDYQTFAYNADLFIEHGSIPDHNDPSVLPVRRMIAWGDSGVLSPQDIADVIAYIYSLNKQ